MRWLCRSWGALQNHKNALHILLPQERVTFIFLNLDTHLEDFKFWMAHELAHVFTPQLAGKDEGGDFADAFCGRLAVPQRACPHGLQPRAGNPGRTKPLYCRRLRMSTVFL